MKNKKAKEFRPLNRKEYISYLIKKSDDHYVHTLRDIVYLRNEMAPLNTYQERAFAFVEHLLQNSTEREVGLFNEKFDATLRRP